ncbi:MAG: tryptophan--tRNA ligase [Candidatus Diapherotrites archaeon]|nr:tryptophan--tRNA ligase [Candidatus Diapherotrites archaeon]
MAEFEVTPWDVSGHVDYDKLVKEFGTDYITDKQLKEIEAITGDLHIYLRRKLFYSQRDLDAVLKAHKSGKGFFLYTGRGPSGDMHIGHLMPFIFTKWLQEKFKVNLYIQITDDEKFAFKQNLSLEDTRKMAREDIANILALGFSPKNTFIMQDSVYTQTYPKALEWSKYINFSTTKAVFGFENATNIASIFYPAVQCVPITFEEKQCLIPSAIDQDPYWRIARDVSHKIGKGYPKTAAIHSKFIPPLSGLEGKMSSSIEGSTIKLNDTPKEVKNKINKYALTGGQNTVEEQRKKGGNPEGCVVFEYLKMLMEEDDKLLEERYKNCKGGKVLCGECKQYLIEKLNAFLSEHQKARAKITDKDINKFLLK